MSNLANYSPYNKTYKFILFQNQAYHEKNKRNVSPMVRTNLKYLAQSYTSNPQTPQQKEAESTQRCDSPSSDNPLTRSFFFKNSKFEQMSDVCLAKKKRVIHKHLSFEKFRGLKVENENKQLVKRIIDTKCEVIKLQKTQNHFTKHRKYSDIRRKYQQNGGRKEGIPMGNKSLLCPTLSQFHEVGLASKFIEKDLSMSIKAPSTSIKAPSTSRSLRKSRYPNEQDEFRVDIKS